MGRPNFLRLFTLREDLSSPNTSCFIISCNNKSILRMKKDSPYSIIERRVPELIPVLGRNYRPTGGPRKYLTHNANAS